MIQTLKSIILQDWKPAGGDIVPSRQNDMMPYAPQVAFSSERVQSGYDLKLSQADLQRLTIKLSMLIKLPVDRLRVLERYHRVFLVAYVPFGQLDPVLPVTAVPLGDEHNEAYARLSSSIHAWQPDGDTYNGATYHTSFLQNGNYLAKKCINAAAQVLEPDEVDYYATQMLYSLAYPRRNSGHF